jgi:hypothetical protein
MTISVCPANVICIHNQDLVYFPESDEFSSRDLARITWGVSERWWSSEKVSRADVLRYLPGICPNGISEFQRMKSFMHQTWPVIDGIAAEIQREHSLTKQKGQGLHSQPVVEQLCSDVETEVMHCIGDITAMIERSATIHEVENAMLKCSGKIQLHCWSVLDK